MAEEIILDDVPGDPPFVRKPLSEQKRVDLPPYPGLPSETGQSSVMLVPKRKSRAQPAQPTPSDQPEQRA